VLSCNRPVCVIAIYIRIYVYVPIFFAPASITCTQNGRNDSFFSNYSEYGGTVYAKNIVGHLLLSVLVLSTNSSTNGHVSEGFCCFKTLIARLPNRSCWTRRITEHSLFAAKTQRPSAVLHASISNATPPKADSALGSIDLWPYLKILSYPRMFRRLRRQKMKCISVTVLVLAFLSTPVHGGRRSDGRESKFLRRHAPRNLLSLVFRGAEPNFQLSRCEGDCDDDSDCIGSLICYQKTLGGTGVVPGCSRTDTSNTDFCVDPGKNGQPR
jgi:hypothetical protein